MSSKTGRAPVATPVERAAQRTDLATPVERGQPEHSTPTRRLSLEVVGLAAAVVTTLITYGIYTVYPWPHSTLSEFLAMLARDNASIWPMQLVWYAGAAAIVALASWPRWPRRRTTQVICLLAAAYLAWIGIAFFAVLNSGMNFAWFWAAVFVLEGVLFLVAGVVRHDLVIAPRWDHWDLASVLGAVFIAYALIAYPIIGMLGGHAPSTLPVFGLAPCPTAIFALGLLLWSRPPAPLYLLPFLLAWCFGAAPVDLSRGVVADAGLVVVGLTTALVILWRDRTVPWQTVAAGAVLTLMIGWSGHEDVLMGIALVLVAVTLVQAIRGKGRGAAPLAPESSERDENAGAIPVENAVTKAPVKG